MTFAPIIRLYRLGKGASRRGRAERALWEHCSWDQRWERVWRGSVTAVVHGNRYTIRASRGKFWISSKSYYIYEPAEDAMPLADRILTAMLWIESLGRPPSCTDVVTFVEAEKNRPWSERSFPTYWVEGRDSI
jgi:hypothetical protein